MANVNAGYLDKVSEVAAGACKLDLNCNFNLTTKEYE